MDFQQQVREAFRAGGPLSNATTQFLPREGQTQMSIAVSRAIEEGGALVVEAGTGIGKTFAYLVPALLSGERVLISTATKALQDQLFGRDLPCLADALGVPVRSALLKGRGSYLCLHRLAQACMDGDIADPATGKTLARIDQWSRQTRSGDLAELPNLDERSSLISRVTSTRENCLGSGCPDLRTCHVNLARRDALAADIVIVNHHLFFADLAVRESGVAELLPTVRVVVFDEAHQINEVGVQFLGIQLSMVQLTDFAKDLLATGWRLARGLADWQGLTTAINGVARSLVPGRDALRHVGMRLRWDNDVLEGLSIRATLENIGKVCAQCASTLAHMAEIAPDLARLQERAEELVRRATVFAGASEEGFVRWIDVGTQLRLVQAPLHIADVVQSHLLGTDDGETQGRAWIFTSATLGMDQSLRWFTEPCGLSHATILRVGSPFEYARQASVYIPSDLALPNSPDHSSQVARFVSRSARQLGGRTLVLTTTLRALQLIGEELRSEFGGSKIEILVQGEQPKRELIERFRQSDIQRNTGYILVASTSFWEGIDVPGDALQLLVIDKLPFPSPNDPLVEARSRRIEQLGRSAFSDYLIPEAAIALKQGAGRLIRRESDQGILVVCDNRLNIRSYGRRLMAALPPMKRLNSVQEFQNALENLTTISTRAATQT